MAHWKLTLSYDGTSFHGWQVQPGLATVQGRLAEAIEYITGEVVLPQGSGRTDAGVHALAQVASFTLQAAISAANLQRALNRGLPQSIRILCAEEVPPSFHARHSALAKTYEYRIFQRRAPAAAPEAPDRICPPFVAPYAWDCRWPLDMDRMNEAAAALTGEHDFASFAASDPDRAQREAEADLPQSTVRTISSSGWSGSNETLVYRIHGSGFLHHMVRNIVGTLVDVGRGSLASADIPGILAARNRAAAGPTAPAHGLFLVSVDYPKAAR